MSRFKINLSLGKFFRIKSKIESPTIYSLGIYKGPQEIKIALLHLSSKIPHILKTQIIPLNVNPLDILAADILEKETLIVTGLEAEQVVLKELLLKLQKERKIAEVLPFQAENIIPFPSKEAIIIPFLRKKEGETEVSLFATKKSYLENLLSYFSKRGVDPDIVSSTYNALFRWVKWSFPSLKEYSLIHESTCIVVSNNKIVATHFVQEETKERLKAYLSSKFPDLPLINLEHPLSEFALPIGMALEGLYFQDGNSLQFRQKEYLSLKKRKAQNQKSKKYILASLLLSATLFLFGTLFSYIKEKQLSENLSAIFPVEKSLSLEEKIKKAQFSLNQYKKIFPFFPNTYSVSDILSFLSTYPEPIEITFFQYVLENHPSLENKNTPYLARVDITLKAENADTAHQFLRFLKKEASFVDQEKEISWSHSQQEYKTSFYLQEKHYAIE